MDLYLNIGCYTKTLPLEKVHDNHCYQIWIKFQTQWTPNGHVHLWVHLSR